jgi:hypothetical protein
MHQDRSAYPNASATDEPLSFTCSEDDDKSTGVADGAFARSVDRHNRRPANFKPAMQRAVIDFAGRDTRRKVIVLPVLDPFTWP